MFSLGSHIEVILRPNEFNSRPVADDTTEPGKILKREVSPELLPRFLV